MAELRERIEPFLKAPPDKTLSFVAEMDMGVPEGVPVVYACPMHPEVVSDEPGSCPKCGMKLLAASGRTRRPTSARCIRRSRATSRTGARSAA